MQEFQRLQWLSGTDVALRTPAFIVDQRQLAANTAIAADAVRSARTRLLFAMKSFSIASGLRTIAAGCDGLHVSSLYEARLARQVLGRSGLVHLTTPGLRDDEFDELCTVCDYISFNSLSQWERFRDRVQGRVSCGLRINPQLSLVRDVRYDPCRPHSKLGEPLDRLGALLVRDDPLLQGLDGILVHTNCDAVEFDPLLATVRRLQRYLQPLLQRLRWINLGGGYLFDEADDTAPLREAIERLEQSTQATVLFEPGAAISRSGAHLVTRVLDCFNSGGKQVAVLDTSVNHLPEAFEYDWPPTVVGAVPEGPNTYMLAGATCLAGDLLGEFAFAQPLQAGSRLVFAAIGAYSMVKAHFFNGVNLPSIYSWIADGNLRFERGFTYDDYLPRCGC